MFEKFVKANDECISANNTEWPMDERPIKLKKHQKFCLIDQCLSDELKFAACSELIMEPHKVYMKKNLNT